MIKISLIISAVGFIMFLLAMERAEVLYKSLNKEAKTTKRVPLIYWIRIIIMFLIPIINILMLLIFGWVFIFAVDKFYEDRVFSEVEKDKE